MCKDSDLPSEVTWPGVRVFKVWPVFRNGLALSNDRFAVLRYNVFRAGRIQRDKLDSLDQRDISIWIRED